MCHLPSLPLIHSSAFSVLGQICGEQICACLISARKTKQLDATTMFTYSHANTSLGQSERAYYLSYFINVLGQSNFYPYKLFLGRGQATLQVKVFSWLPFGNQLF